MSDRKRPKNKVTVYTKTINYLNKYNTVILTEIKDMPANNIHKMRKQLRLIDSEALCGKTTVIEKAILAFVEGKIPSFHKKETLLKLAEKLAGHQLSLIFTNKDLSDITKITDVFQVEKQSKVGAISPVEITLPAGPTGMDASQVEYFQNLRIQTKVVKNQLDIINPTKILTVGQKITLSEINLMNKFNIKPFRHRIEYVNIIINGVLYDTGILNINNEVLEKAVLKGIQNIAAFGLQTGISNKASAPHVIGKAFQNILGLSLGLNVEISQAKGLKAAAATPAPVQAAAPVKETKKPEPKKEEKKPEPEEDDDVGFGGLF
jgi:large subunit ribosomal protein LP0